MGFHLSQIVEWIDPGYILISICCEPAVGGFELLAMPATSKIDKPFGLTLNSGSLDISDNGSFLFEVPTGFNSRFHAIGVVEFNPYFDNSDPDYPIYSLTGDRNLYRLSFDQEDFSSGIDGFVRNVSWLNNDRIAFDLWTFDLLGSEVFSWIGIIDLTQQSVSLNSRSPGWSIPTGDELGNFVVTQQPCNYYVSTCDQDRSRIVTVDSHTLLPIHELEVDGEIADMDLVRGWLLITLIDGQMGTIDFEPSRKRGEVGG